MSEEHRKRNFIDDMESAKLSPYDKTPISFPITITAEQKEKIVRLCENTMNRGSELIHEKGKMYFRCKYCKQKTPYITAKIDCMDKQIKHIDNNDYLCDYLISKQLLSELTDERGKV